MSSSDIVIVLVVVTAIGFDFTNGFHDTANAMATSIATRALPPKVAVGLAALLNFVITQLETLQGFGAETSSAMVILAASQAGYPLSTTHVTSGGVMGAGVGKRAAAVNWTTAQKMAFAWLVTIPAAGVVAAAFYLLVDGLGKDIAGPLAVSALGAVAASLLFFAAQRSNPVTAQDV